MLEGGGAVGWDADRDGVGWDRLGWAPPTPRPNLLFFIFIGLTTFTYIY